ncbi:MAG: hypothetical protein A2Y71_15950 [Bacteroidetes bacterium RBG_13_42_15]|nr:MAG: hypothetical protein A2Y71_15950 [Bacteroidetes bacterium RBG_13_42_15]
MDRILTEVSSYAKNPNLDLLKKAYKFTYNAHRYQLRKSGEPYIEHCLETAKILSELRMDPATIAAGLLHDVVEDTGIQIHEVKTEFGNEIAQLVDGVTKIGELKFQSQVEKQAENFRKMIFSMAKDLRVILIKFADRLHNMRTLEYLPHSKAERIARETREVYAPLAHRFGIARIKWELEDLAFKVLEPDDFKVLSRQVAEQRDKRERTIRKLTAPIKKSLEEQHIPYEVTGRAKHLYSIYRKMQKRKKSFDEIYDLLAIRIIVDRLDHCYFALGIVHTLYTPLPELFKDYIATPKLNMYQSLHTTVMNHEGKLFEIQVRTREMHRIAEIGIAAHWKYKEEKRAEDELDRYSVWLREMVDWQKDTLEPEEYLDILKTDLFISEVFIFTPKGDLIKLPKDSTPIDFAFSVHTDIGFHCIGAKVNSRIVPLNTILKSGDSVEIITSANQKPNRDWISYVKTSKAKSKIKHWFKEAELHEAIKLGEELLQREFKRNRITTSKEKLKDVAHALGKTSLERLYADLGQAEISVQKVIEKLAPEKANISSPEHKDNFLERFILKARSSAKGIRVQGIDNLLIRFAKCCHPVPGDEIIGFISKGRGIVIHRTNCINALNLMQTPEKTVEVNWDVERGESFLVQLRIIATGRRDFVKDVGESMASMETNIVKIDMNTENAIITAHIIVEVHDLAHLNKIIRRLYRLKGILSIERGSDIREMSQIST